MVYGVGGASLMARSQRSEFEFALLFVSHYSLDIGIYSQHDAQCSLYYVVAYLWFALLCSMNMEFMAVSGLTVTGRTRLLSSSGKSGKSSSKGSKSSSSPGSKSSKTSQEGIQSTTTLSTSTSSTILTTSTTGATSVTTTSSITSTLPETTIVAGQSCSVPQILPVPSTLFDQNLSNIPATPNYDNPAVACADRFNFPDATVKWYEVTAQDNTCFCVRLSSFDNAFIIGVLQSDDKECNDSTRCINESDFTSQSIAWRTSPSTTYKLAVSVLPGGGSPDVGTFLLNVVDSGPDACPEMEGSSQLIPFGCPMTQCEMAVSKKNCLLLDYCDWCSEENEESGDISSSFGRCVSRKMESQGVVSDSCS
jgi:hypothetical protein